MRPKNGSGGLRIYDDCKCYYVFLYHSLHWMTIDAHEIGAKSFVVAVKFSPCMFRGLGYSHSITITATIDGETTILLFSAINFRHLWFHYQWFGVSYGSCNDVFPLRNARALYGSFNICVPVIVNVCFVRNRTLTFETIQNVSGNDFEFPSQFIIIHALHFRLW